MKPFPLLLLAATVVGAVACSLTLAQHVVDDAETVTPLQRRTLVDPPGRQVVMATITYRPGQASTPHRHAGSVFAYVLEGAVTSQLEGGPAVTYATGQSWYEPPRTPHLVSRNASATRPAKLLAFLLLDDGADVREPLPVGTEPRQSGP
jgi:quercetin dioxygenase-like cupin family protein